MSRLRTDKVILAGFVATAAMTVLLYSADVFNMPHMDIAAMLGAILNGGRQPAIESGKWWVGMIWHFINGSIIFALIYAYWLEPHLHDIPRLPDLPWVRGAVWGAVLWLLFELVGLPFMGMGIFGASSPHTLTAIVSLLVVFLIYGGILGSICAEHSRDPIPEDWRGIPHPHAH